MAYTPAMNRYFEQSPTTIVFQLFGVAVLFLLSKTALNYYRPNFEHIPTAGLSSRLPSYIGGIKFIFKARDVLRYGYHAYPDAVFKIPTIGRWEFIVSGTKLINDIRMAKDDELSFHHASSDNTQLEYTTKAGVYENPYHMKLVQTSLTSNFGLFAAELHEETVDYFDELIPPTSEEWKSFPALDTIVEVIARSGNRLFVGYPLCRDPEYLKLAINYTSDIVIAAQIINHTPTFLQPIVGWLVSPYQKNKRAALGFLGPLLEERLKEWEENRRSQWHDKPNDLISWMLDCDESDEEQRIPENLVMRILFINFAATHTTSVALTHAIFDLVSHPEYITSLREEAQEVIGKEGWTKGATSKMYKLDSFVRESMRVNGISGFTTMRKVISPAGFTFSNGVWLPYGSFVASAGEAIHHDESLYRDAEVFDGMRFYNMGTGGGGDEERGKYAFTTPSLEYLAFGIGRHACPGRFFAAHQLKSTLAHILLNFDIELREGKGNGKVVKEGKRPENYWLAYACVPDMSTQLSFRRRCE